MFTITTLRQSRRGDRQNRFARLVAQLWPTNDIREVTAEKVVMSAERIDQALRIGALRSTDLVELDGTLIALADALPFLDAAAVAERRERRGAFMKKCLQALLLVGFVASHLLLRVWVASYRAAPG